jgi:hypothetical protein
VVALVWVYAGNIDVTHYFTHTVSSGCFLTASYGQFIVQYLPVVCGESFQFYDSFLDFVRMIVNRARQLCSGIHKVQEEGVDQGTCGDELH